MIFVSFELNVPTIRRSKTMLFSSVFVFQGYYLVLAHPQETFQIDITYTFRLICHPRPLSGDNLLKSIAFSNSILKFPNKKWSILEKKSWIKLCYKDRCHCYSKSKIFQQSPASLLCTRRVDFLPSRMKSRCHSLFRDMQVPFKSPNQPYNSYLGDQVCHLLIFIQRGSVKCQDGLYKGHKQWRHSPNVL